MKLPSAATTLKGLAKDQELAIRQAIGIPGSNRGQYGRLVAHVADRALAKTRVRTYEPILGSDLRCPRCWVREGKVCLLEKTGVYRSDDVDVTKVDRSDKEYQVRCATCELLVLLPLE